MHGTSIIPSKNDGRKVMKMTNLFSYNILTFVLAWPNSLKSFISAPVRLIGKRGLICDHRNIGLKNFGRICLLLENICLLLSDFDRGQF